MQTALNERRTPLLLLGFVLLCTAPIITHPGWIAHWPAALYNDLLISHLPLSQIAHDLLFNWHQTPLWNPYLLSGMPLAADPLAGLTYPPNWMAILWPGAQVVNLLLIGHLVWAGIGAWLLAGSEGAGRAGAIASGLIFGGAAKLVTHLSLGHLGLVSAASWTPWVLLGIRKALQAPTEQSARSAGLAGLSIGLIFLADPRWLIPAGLLAVAYFISARNWADTRLTLRQLLKRGLLLSVFALGMSACLSLPLWELVKLSTRSGLSLGEQTVYSLNALDLLGMFVFLPREPEQFIYIGSAVVFLSLLAFLRPSRTTWFWGGIAVGATLLAMGPATPLYAIFSRVIPGAGFLRVPGRFFILSILAVALLAGKGMQLLLMRADGVLERRSRILGVTFFVFVIALNGAVWAVRGWPSTLAMLPVIIALAALLLLFRSRNWIEKSEAVLTAWLILIAIEAAFVDCSLLDMRPIQNESSARLADRIAADAGVQRVFSPTFSLAPLQSAQRGIESVEGISPLQLAAYRAYLGTALGFDPSVYSVPLPPVTPDLDPARYDLEQLAKLSVTWILSNQPIERNDLIAEGVVDGVRLYRLVEPKPHIEFTLSDPGAFAGQSLRLISWSPNRITIHTSSSGRLVLREVNYPGWIALIDGRRTEILVEEDLFRAIEVPSGEHEIEFVFQPWMVFMGWGTTFLTLAALWVIARRT